MPVLTVNDEPPTERNQPEALPTLPDAPGSNATTGEGGDPKTQSPVSERPSQAWPDFIESADLKDIERRFQAEAQATLSKALGDRYCCLAILEHEDSIDQFELNQLYRSLSRLNPKRDKDVLPMLLSGGGRIEPAYQISKICKDFAKDRFVVCVPRNAKSAATLLALGADEIHMGPLGHLGPIDPQLGGLPALGVSQALETLAGLAERYPGSSDMFARYLRLALTVEQIGYYDRICASAEQYAVRLLSTKSKLPKPPSDIARELVHEYKDHGFVIDLAEARQHLGADWIKSDSIEVRAAEEIFRLFEMVGLFLGAYKAKKILVVGGFDSGVYIWEKRPVS